MRKFTPKIKRYFWVSLQVLAMYLILLITIGSSFFKKKYFRIKVLVTKDPFAPQTFFFLLNMQISIMRPKLVM
jgi:hypothetical protein